MKHLKSIFPLAAVVLLAAGNPVPVHGQTTVKATELSRATGSGGEVNIEADKMEVLEDQNKAIFTGKVDAVRGNVKLKCTKLIVTYVSVKKPDGKSKTDVTFLDATGAVQIITRKQRINGKWAKMNVRTNKLDVGGGVVVYQGQTIIRGKKLSVDLKTNKSRFHGGRVKGIFGTSK